MVVIRLRAGPTSRNKRVPSSPQSSDRHCGLTSIYSIGTEALALDAKRPWRDAKYSLNLVSKVRTNAVITLFP